MDDRRICPCCGKHHFDEVDFYEVCPICGWEDDPLQRDEPDYEGGANEISLNEHRKLYESGWRPTWTDDDGDYEGEREE